MKTNKAYIREMKPVLALKALRAMREVNQETLAKAIGSTTATYNRKENGFTPFNTREVNLILKFFNVKYEDVFMSRGEE